jgi:hypothetical protein
MRLNFQRTHHYSSGGVEAPTRSEKTRSLLGPEVWTRGLDQSVRITMDLIAVIETRQERGEWASEWTTNEPKIYGKDVKSAEQASRWSLVVTRLKGFMLIVP